MRRSYRPIPQWYVEDWSPAQGRGELPGMTWPDVETTIMRLIAEQSRQDQALSLLRLLWLRSTQLEPMELLQQLLWTGARILNPIRPRQEPLPKVPNRATGSFPRWSFTDVEVALSYTWRGQALLIANERHRDLLTSRGEGASGAETARQIFLLVSGLPTAPARMTSEAAMDPPPLNAAA